MKKQYIAPELKSAAIRIESGLLVGSPKPIIVDPEVEAGVQYAKRRGRMDLEDFEEELIEDEDPYALLMN